MQDSGDESWAEDEFYREINGRDEEFQAEHTRHRDNTMGAVWGAFQESATAVAHLYRERSSNTYPDTAALWLPFQTAAGTITTLYKESCDGIKRTSDAAVNTGYQRRTREIADWARSKKRRMIRREDLLAYLAGKPPPPLSAQNANRRSPKPEQSHTQPSLGGALYPSVAALQTTPAVATVAHMHAMQQNNNNNNTHQTAATLTNEQTQNDLHTFKEALVLKPRGPELFAFVANEIARHCKRPASPIDDKMDVCHYSSKRQRFM